MHRFALFVLATISVISPARAADRWVAFADEVYHCRFVSVTDTIRLAEYTRDGDSIDKWEKLIGVWHYPMTTGSPEDGAAAVIRELQAKRPTARFQFLKKEDRSEAMVDFITWPDDGSYAEFNVFRYRRLPGQSGLVAYQFAYRFDGRAANAAESIRKARAEWLDVMSRTDMELNFEPVDK